MRSLAGRYRVEEAVGRGGSAVVHSGYDRTLKRRVAIKLFTPYRSDNGGPSIDVLREARAAAALSHPHIARVYDYGEATEGGQRLPYLVMEFLEGDTVADRLAATGAFAWARAAEICADVAAALAAAHARDLVHRDVKPRNIMLTPGGVKVLDFGIAALAGQDGYDSQGQLWGTPASLAPEQLRGEPTFPAADVYALGLLLFECLTGARAWPGDSAGEVLAARAHRRPPRLPGIAGLPRTVVRLYEACVADDQSRRPSAVEVAEVLRQAAGRTPTVRSATVITRTIAAPVRPKGSRSRAAITASIAVAAAFVSIIGLQVANGYSTPGGREAEAAVDGAPVTRAPQPISTPSPTSTKLVPDVPSDNERPVRRVADTWTREAGAPSARPVTPKPKPSSEAPTVRPPTTRPPGPGPAPSDPPPTTADPEPEQPSEPPPTTEPPTESTTTPPPPDPEDPPPGDGDPVQNVVLAGL